MYTKDVWKISKIGEVTVRKILPTLKKLLFNFLYLNSVIETHCLNLITNMDNIRQERPEENPILNSNKRLKQTLLNREFNTNVKESMVSQVFQK